MRKFVAVLGHWRTGSRLLMQILEACGMWLGDEKTGFVWSEGLDHPLLNTIGNLQYHGYEKKTKEDVISVLKRIRANTPPHKKFSGFKVSHALQEPCWEIFKPALEEVFPELCVVVPFRKKAEIMESMDGISGWTREKIARSVDSCDLANKELLERGVEDWSVSFVRYPIAYQQKYQIQTVVKFLGLTWSRKADMLYKEEGVPDV